MMIEWSTNKAEAVGGRCDGVFITAPARTALLADIGTRLAEGRGFRLATLNLDHVIKLRRDPAFKEAYLRQSHVTADGNPIVWLSRLSGHPVDLIAGADLVEPIASMAAQLGIEVALIGATEASLDAAAKRLVDRHPGFRVVLRLAPAMGFDPCGPEADACIDCLKESGAQLCFVALGAPKQEIFADRAGNALPGVGFLSIGAGLDFISGAQVRAPKMMRALALEWLWRLAGNPRRMAARYGACLAILPGLTYTACRARLGRLQEVLD